jgi:hypothetical protein
VVGATLEGAPQLGLQIVERDPAIAFEFVAQVVGQTGEAVDRFQVETDLAREQAECDREVLAGRLREDLTGPGRR